MCWTLNNYTEDELAILRSWSPETAQYVLWGFENAPTTGTPHLQGYVFWTKKKTIKGAHKELPRAKFIICKGSPQQNKDYCTKVKNGKFEEYGEFPEQGARSDLETLVEAVKAGKRSREICEEQTATVAKHTTFYKMLKTLYVQKRVYNDGERPELEFHIGASRTGKSRAVFAKYPEAYVANFDNGGNSNWFDGYDGEEIIIFDEYCGQLPLTSIKRMCDWYPYAMQTKGGTVGILAKKFIFTSCVPPDQWYWDRDHNDEWKNRVAEFGKIYKYSKD